MQLRFQDKEHFFHDTAQMLRSGIPLPKAWEQLARGRDRAAAAARSAAPALSINLDVALEAGGFSVVDREILAAGEQSGRLEEACRELADYYAQLAKGRNRAIAASLYPVFILHLAALLLSIPPAIIDGDLSKFFLQAAAFLGTAYLGRAGRASRSASVEEAAVAAVHSIRSGAGFADSLANSRAFPADLESGFRVAEASGRLDEETTRWAGIYRERFFKRIDTLTEWLPRLLYLLVVAMVVFRMFALISQITGVYSSVLEM